MKHLFVEVQCHVLLCNCTVTSLSLCQTPALCIHTVCTTFWCCPDSLVPALLQEKVGQASLDIEKKGLRASEKSDHNVHKAYDKTADALSDVKGDAKDKAREAKGNVKDASHKAEAKADRAADKADKKSGGGGCVIM